MSYRTRRLLYSRWRRLVRWEFWPTLPIYLPVAVFILLLGIRHRCLSLFTCSSPGIPASGFALTSKAAILDGFGSGHPQLAPYTLIRAEGEAEQRVAELEAFMEREGLEFPVVLKPDDGARGQGVAIVRDATSAAEYLAGAPRDVVAQKYIGGQEFGVFYVRDPRGPDGRVISLTEKRPCVVVGDGEHDLEHLILADRRAVCYAKRLLEKNRDRLREVPDAGEEVTVAAIGSHSRGALFLDGAELLTPELEAAIDRLSKDFEGFFYGRYDLKVPDREALRAGRDIQVIELNAVTSEPTHMYDPKHGLLRAWWTLCGVWRRAYSIAAANRKLGARPLSLRATIALGWRYLRTPKWEPPAPGEGKPDGA